MNKTFTNAIKPLRELMDSYGMEITDWCISGEYAWIVNGYDVSIRENHIDLYVKESRLPWVVRDRIQTIPPKHSQELEQYSDFVEKNKIALHMVPLPKPKVSEHLIDKFAKKTQIGGVSVNVIDPVGNLYDLGATLGAYELNEFGEDRLTRWEHYLRTVYNDANEKNDKHIAEKAKELLKRYFKVSV
jgi:hypothetical protein